MSVVSMGSVVDKFEQVCWAWRWGSPQVDKLEQVWGSSCEEGVGSQVNKFEQIHRWSHGTPPALWTDRMSRLVFEHSVRSEQTQLQYVTYKHGRMTWFLFPRERELDSQWQRNNHNTAFLGLSVTESCHINQRKDAALD